MKLQNLILMLLATAVLFSCKKDDGAEPANTAPDIENQTTSVSQDQQAGTPFYTVEAEDDDGDTLSFSISENDNGLFAISTSGQLSVAAGQSLDVANSPHTIKVSVTDQKDAKSATITINVTEVGETNQAPTINNEVFEFEASENISDDETIGTVDASDPEGQTLEYDVISQIELIEISDDGQLSLVAGEAFDYETSTSHTVRIRVSDGENIVDTDFTIVVTNVIDEPFVTTWVTATDGESIGFYVEEEYIYDYSIDWGDGSPIEQITESVNQNHIYESAGEYTVKIIGDFPTLKMSNVEDPHPSASKLRSIDQWGEIVWQDMKLAFMQCPNLTYNATDAPNLENVTDLSYMFHDATAFDGDLSNWNVGTIITMERMFAGATSFNGNINNWNVSKVTDMSYMFNGAESFNQNIGAWDVSKVESFFRMFTNAFAFNQDIGGWTINTDVDEVSMGLMFSGAAKFNQDLSGWDVSKVGPMHYMFYYAEAFDQSLGGWNISNVTTMSHMLDGSGMTTENYNATLHSWVDQVEENNALENITLGSAGLIYCDEGITVHDELTNIYGWTILGDFSCFD